MRLQLLHEAGIALQRRADEQAATSKAWLQARSGAKLQRHYEISSGGGAPWRVDETHPNYLAHERARYSCANCSGDVVPEFDLVGCWPLWPQFAPDELTYTCPVSYTHLTLPTKRIV